MVTGQAPATPEWRDTPGKKHKQTKSGTRIVYIIADAMLASARKYKKSEIGSQPTMWQVHTDTYLSLLAPEKPTTPLAT